MLSLATNLLFSIPGGPEEIKALLFRLIEFKAWLLLFCFLRKTYTYCDHLGICIVLVTIVILQM